MKRVPAVLLTTAVYYGAARLGLLLAFEGTNASPVWPPSGIALALLLLLGRDVWPGILLGAFFSNLQVFRDNHASSLVVLWAVSASIAAGNTLEGLAGRALFRRWKGDGESFSRLSTLTRFFVSALLACSLAATVGALSLAVSGITPSVSGMVWLTWWLGDVVGMLVITPLILTWAEGDPRPASWQRGVEAMLLAVSLLASASVGFGVGHAPLDTHFPLAFLVMPPMVWSAIRFGPRGASAAVLAVGTVATWGAVAGMDPSGPAGFHMPLLLAQAYVGVLALTHLALAAAVAELHAARQSLQEAAGSLEQRVTERTALAEHRAAQLRSLAGELVQTEHRERRQLSKVLHDHVQQLLAAAQMQLARLGRTPPEEHHAVAATASRLLSESIAALRDLSVRLSPPILHDQGLEAGVRWLSRDMKAKHGLAVDVIADDGCPEMDDTTTIMAFEATRELLFNVTKHSGSRQATVRLGHGTGGSLTVCVEDSGRGFDSHAVRSGGRQGLGLFSLSERIQSLSGRVEVDSAPGRGTRVTLEIPWGAGRNAVHAAEVMARRRAVPEPIAGAIRVLVADDHALFRQGLVSLLEKESGLEVIGQAADGAEAVRLAGELSPDVVVLDVSMPRMSGLEAARILRARFPAMIIIGLSMFGDPDMSEPMRAAGASAYLSKDRASDELTALIRAARAH